MIKVAHHRFWKKAIKHGKCWEWSGSRKKGGYGEVRYNGKTSLAHRVAFILSSGRKIPKGMCVMHTCDNPPCINPSHLLLGTMKQNMLDRDKKGRRIALKHGKHPMAKLNEIDVHDIRSLYGFHTQKELSKIFDVSETQIWRIINHKSWV